MTPLFSKTYAAEKTARATLVLLHGWGFDHRCWQGVQPFLQPHYDVRALDLPGFGASSVLLVDTAQDWLAQTLILIEAELAKVSGPIVLVGWSLGGQLALRLASGNAAIHAVIGVATNLQFCANQRWLPAMPENIFSTFLSDFSTAPEKTLKRFSRLVAAGDNQLALRRCLPALMAGYNSAQQSNWLFGLEALQLLDHTQTHFTVPVTLILFDADALVPIDLTETLASSEAIHVRCIAGASHGHLLGQPKVVADCILEILDAQ